MDIWINTGTEPTAYRRPSSPISLTINNPIENTTWRYLGSQTSLPPTGMGHLASTMGPPQCRPPWPHARGKSRYLAPTPHGPSQRAIRPRTFDARSRSRHHRRTYSPKRETKPCHPRTLARTRRPHHETQHHSRHCCHRQNTQEDH